MTNRDEAESFLAEFLCLAVKKCGDLTDAQTERFLAMRGKVVDALAMWSGELDASFERFLASTAMTCRNCLDCSSRPCEACTAGGVCDRRCNCPDEDEADASERDYDPDEDRAP